MRRSVSLLIPLLSLATVRPGVAQTAPAMAGDSSHAQDAYAERPFALPEGARVRVTLREPEGSRTTGRVLRADSQGLVLAVGDPVREWRVARDSVLRMEVGSGAPAAGDRALRGAGAGFLVGLGLTAAFYLSTAHDEGGDDSPGFVALALGIPATAATTLIGTVAGLASRERWSPTRVPLRLTASKVANSRSGDSADSPHAAGSAESAGREAAAPLLLRGPGSRRSIPSIRHLPGSLP